MVDIFEKWIDEVKIDGYPMSWFVKRFIEINLLPKPFLSFDQIKKQKQANGILIRVYSIVFRKYLYYSELLRRKICRKPISSQSDEVLFITYSNHLTIKDGFEYFRINSVIKEANDSNLAVYPLLCDNLARINFHKIRAHPNSIYQYYTKEVLNKSKASAKQQHAEWMGVSEEKKKHMFGDYYNSMKFHLDLFYSYEYLFLVNLYLNAFKKLFNKRGTKLLFLTAMNSLFEKCAILAANEINIPTIMAQHGVALGFANLDVKNLDVHFALFGKKYKEELIVKGVSKDKIEVTGPIIFDDLIPFIDKPRIQQLKKNILIMTTPFVEHNFLDKKKYFNRIEKILKESSMVKESVIKLKLHPREKFIAEYEKITSKLDNVEVVKDMSRKNHFALIHECDVMVNFGSTAALEAMILKKPTITIDIFDKNNPINKFILDSYATLQLNYKDDITISLYNSFKKGFLQIEMKKFIGEHCYLIDSNIYKRVVSMIKRLIKNEIRK